MCGIARLLKICGPVTPEDSAAIERMTGGQMHLVSDGSGVYVNTLVVLEHRRPSIIALSDAGKQSMANEDATGGCAALSGLA